MTIQKTFHFQYHQPLLGTLNRTAPKSPLLTFSLSRPHRNMIVRAGKRKGGSGFPIPNKWLLELVAANSSIPQTVDLAIRLICGGGFGWGRRRGNKRKLGLGLLVVSGLLFGRGSESALLWKVSAIAIGFVLLKNWSRELKVFMMGLCWFGVLVVLGMRKEDRQKWVERVRDCSLITKIVAETKGSGSGRRRAL